MGMSKQDRLLFILNLLRSRKNLNAAQLAAECGVTERSIYRDMLSLSEANVPIYYDNGYKVASENFLPPLNFSFEEYRALKMALESSPLSKAGSYAELFRQVQAKIEAGLTDGVREQKRFAIPTTDVEVPLTVHEELAASFFTQIEEAVLHDLVLDMEYDSIAAGVARREVEPYFIVFRGRAFYFVAYCHEREDFRTFRIDRVKALAIKAEHFRRKSGIDAKSYFGGSWQFHRGEPVEVVVRFVGRAARVVASSRHHADETVEVVNPEEVIYRVTVSGIEEIKRWILGFGAEALVLEPPELRDSMVALVKALAALYEPSQK